MKPSIQRIGIREKIGYGFGGLGADFIWMAVMSYMMFYYTDIFGISAAATGTLFLIAKLWDAVNDPIMGNIADRTSSRWGKYRPWLLWMAFPYGFLAVLAFTTPDLTPAQKLIYAYVTYITLAMAFTAVHIPYAVLTSAISQDPDERVSLSTFRLFFSFLGGVITNVAMLPLVGMLGKGDEQRGYQLTMALFAVVAVIALLYCFKTIRERVTAVVEKKPSLTASVMSLKGNVPWLITLLMAISGQLVHTMKNSVVMYYFSYNVGRQDLVPLFMLVSFLPVLIAMPIGNMLAQRIDKKKTIYIGCSLSTVFSAVLFFTDPQQNLPMVFISTGIASFGLGLIVPPMFAMLADVIEYSEWKSGVRAAGFLYSASSFGGKLGTGIGGALLGWALTVTGYVPNVVQNAGTLLSIRLMLGGIPAIAGVLTIVLMMFYNLDKKQFQIILSDLEKRKQAAATSLT